MRFRSPERMQSEAGYYVTNLQGAMSFIETMDASCLSISQEEFDKNIEMTIWEMELEKRTKERNLAQQQQQQQTQHQQQRADGVQRKPVQQDMAGERAQWLIDRSSVLAKSTLEKTNNFVGRLISEFSSPSASESGRSTPIPSQALARDVGQRSLYPGEAWAAASAGIGAGASTSESPEAAGDMAAADGELAIGGPEWIATLGLVRDMFPNIDRDVVDIIFESNAGVVAKTIEQLLDISSDNEVLATATAMAAKSRDETQAPQSSTAGGVSSTAVASSLAASQGQDVAEEMEQWKKGHWATDSDSESESESEYGDDVPAEQKPVHVASAGEATNVAAGSVLPSATVEISKPLPPNEGMPSITFDSPPPSAAAEAKPLQVPDTSGDEEYARKLQEEFERQARIADNN
ncbi:hypothetical protein LPJ73_007891 [Coemansia sp. RSA 2703]|nr:hypothetical protein LPJ73_007891 [Coemansia sp. RSA 2703]